MLRKAPAVLRLFRLVLRDRGRRVWEEAVNYLNVGTDREAIEKENARLLRQSKCLHEVTVTFRKYDKWSTKCELCSLIVGSDATQEEVVRTHEQLL